MPFIQRRRIHYIACFTGVISLLLLVITYCTQFAGHHPPVYSLAIWIPRFEQGLKEDGMTFPPQRNYTDIVLDNKQDNNAVKLAFSQIRIQEIIAQNDSLHGVHYHFTDSSTLGNFTQVLALLKQERAKRYIIDGSDIWFMHMPERPAPPEEAMHLEL